MTSEIVSTLVKCPGCGRSIEIDRMEMASGSREYGGFILECLACGRIFEDYVGEDFRCSSVRSGARLVDRHGGDVDRERALRRYGLIS
jgi:DNA-directed RNA polymerase subunit RPC12/RpoP